MDSDVIDNADRQRFELQLDGQIVFAQYRRQNGVLALTHVEAPPALRGSGAAGRLMQGIMRLLRESGTDEKVLPLCSYAAAWLRRHGNYDDLIA